MECQEQLDHENCHVVVFSQDGTDVLLKSVDAGFVFPSIEIPRWQRLAENLTAALKRDWGCDAVCLFTPNDPSQDSNSNGNRYEAMECWRNESTGEANWKPIRSLTAKTFQNEAEFRVLEQCLHELDDYEHDPSSPFARRGWLGELQSWTGEKVRSKGIELTGPFRQYNASPSFSLIRFETNGPAVWFKAVGEPNRREFPLTLKLAQLFPEYLPELVATRPDWNGWLSLEAPGTNLGQTQEMALWERAAAALARLQVKSIGKTGSILDTGARDLRTAPLSDLADPFLGIMAQLMERQAKVPPGILGGKELDWLGAQIKDSLTLLEELGIPDALGHLDLNAGNIIVSENGYVFVDWAEAYVGHPFLSFEYLLEHFRHAIGADVAREAELVRSYNAPWEQVLPADVIAEALTLAPLAAVFAYAAGIDGWRNQERPIEPKAAGYFRSLARRMHREATQLVDRRPACLS